MATINPSALETVQDYINDVRTLLQDVVLPYRYDDTSLLTSFNTALLEGRRLRPDLFVFEHHERVPSYMVSDATKVCIEPQFRLPFVYGTAAHALARDQEDIQDARATMFMGLFNDLLIGVRLGGISGSGPTPGGRRQ